MKAVFGQGQKTVECILLGKSQRASLGQLIYIADLIDLEITQLVTTGQHDPFVLLEILRRINSIINLNDLEVKADLET